MTNPSKRITPATVRAVASMLADLNYPSAGRELLRLADQMESDEVILQATVGDLQTEAWRVLELTTERDALAAKVAEYEEAIAGERRVVANLYAAIGRLESDVVLRLETQISEYEERMKGRVLVPVCVAFFTDGMRRAMIPWRIANVFERDWNGETTEEVLSCVQSAIDEEDTNA